MPSSKSIKNIFLFTWIIMTIYLSYLAITPKVISTGFKQEVLFSPDDNPQNKILELIRKTTKKIHLAVYTFTNIPLAEALIDAKNRGVDVQVVSDKSSLSSNYSQISKLKEIGIKVFIFPPKQSKYGPLMHHKFALFDSGKNKKLVCTGSLNWTNAACKRNQENIIVTDDETVYERYKNQFQVLRSRSSS